MIGGLLYFIIFLFVYFFAISSYIHVYNYNLYTFFHPCFPSTIVLYVGAHTVLLLSYMATCSFFLSLQDEVQ